VDGLYTELARGRPVAEALRAAKLAALRSGAPPGVWAAFSVVGDPTVVVPLRPPPVQAGWWVGAGSVAAILIAVAVARRRRSSPGETHVAKR
jgi:hypothetical protein